MPTVFQDRAGISLYDAQYNSGEKAPILEETINAVVTSCRKFKRVCSDFAVPQENIRIVATEATREAMNSEQFRDVIKMQVGWEVEMLPKEEEGRIGAMGIASSFTDINGLVLDLGGGSVQMSWISTRNGEVDIRGSTSLPYGAAALLRRINAASEDRDQLQALEHEVKEALASAFHKVTGAAEQGSENKAQFPIFLSGGGFRGWYVICHPPVPHRIHTY